MAKYSTPAQTKNSVPPSVFMTPSSSCGRAVYKAPRSFLTTPVSLSFPSPLSEQSQHSSLSYKEHKDILTHLHAGGYPLLVSRITSLLDTSTIHSSLLVSKSWNSLISLGHAHKPTSHTHSQLVQDENTPIFPQPNKSLRSNRTALGSIIGNPQIESHSPRTPSPSEMVQPSTSKMRPCPSCGSPAKRLTTRRAECTKCHLDFCQHCFKPWHEESSCGVKDVSLSPKKSNNIVLVGTKKSKRRLKRL